MEKLARFFSALFIGVFFLGIALIAEEITLTTYYPAPYGVFEDITVTGNIGIGTTQTVLNAYGDSYINAATGNVGIGTTNPLSKLHVNGNIRAQIPSIAVPDGTLEYDSNGLIGFDVAERFETTEPVQAGDVLVIDDTSDLRLRKSSLPYEKGVIGIVSGAPAILFEGSELEIAPEPFSFTEGTNPPVALAGRIPCKVSLENGPIERGDFLTTSSTSGHAMKVTDPNRAFGTVIGKALQPFTGGEDGEDTGTIVVLVTLQ